MGNADSAASEEGSFCHHIGRITLTSNLAHGDGHISGPGFSLMANIELNSYSKPLSLCFNNYNIEITEITLEYC